MRNTYRKIYRNNYFEDINKHMIAIGCVFVLFVVVGSYLNKLWPSYQGNIFNSINSALALYSGEIPIKDILMSNIKLDVITIISVGVCTVSVVLFPIAIAILIVKGLSIGYTINSVILALKFKGIKMIIITLAKNIIVIPGLIVLMIISFSYIKQCVFEFKQNNRDKMLYLAGRYLLNLIIVLVLTTILQVMVNTIVISIIKFLVR